jgi:hypothetical protein
MSTYQTGVVCLGFKKESVLGTAETLVQADYSRLVRDVSVSPTIEMAKRYHALGDWDHSNSIVGKKSAEVSFKIDLSPGDSVTAADWEGFFEVCGCKKTVHGTTGFSLAPVYIGGADKSATIEVAYLSDDNKQLVIKLAGCAGTVSFGYDDVGMPIEATFAMTGGIVSVTDRAVPILPDTSAIDGETPPAVLGATVLYNGVQMCSSSFNLNSGMKVSPLKCPGSSSGFLRFVPSNPEPVVSLTPYLKSIADSDLWGDWVGGSTKEFSVEVQISGSEPIKISVWSLQITQGYGVADAEGIAQNPITGDANRSETYDGTWEILVGSKT